MRLSSQIILGMTRKVVFNRRPLIENKEARGNFDPAYVEYSVNSEVYNLFTF
jgi:hypothetical protein